MFGRLTPMVKALLFINVGVYLITMLTASGDFNLNQYLALYKLDSDYFAPYQFFTYMFAHSTQGFGHILFNMIGLIVFGAFLENFWGQNRFLTFYMVTGIGAALIYSGINLFNNASFRNTMEEYSMNPNPDEFNRIIVDNARFAHAQLYDFINAYSENPDDPALIEKSKDYLVQLYDLRQRGSMVGASGAIYGLLMACALLFPNMMIMLLIPPIPIKMKYLALILGGIAIYSSFQRNPGDNIAHLAHLGGMVFAYIMIMFWRKQGRDYG